MADDLPIDVDERGLPPPAARITVGKGRWTPVDDAPVGQADGTPVDDAPVGQADGTPDGGYVAPEIPTYAPPGVNSDEGEFGSPVEAVAPPKVSSEEGELGDAFEAAAARTKNSVTSRKQDESEPPFLQKLWTSAVDSFLKAPHEVTKSIDESFAGRYVPEGAVSVRDDGAFLDRDGNELPVTRKPTILPITKDPVTGKWQGAMPSALDVVATPGGTSGRTASLAAGFRLPGIGHNMGPPMPPHTAPAPMVPPPPGGAGSGPQIIRGHKDTDPVTFESLYTQVYDDLNPLKVLQKEINNSGVPIQADEKFYELARLTRGSYGRTEQALKNATFDFKTLQNNGASLSEVLKPVSKDIKTFEEFLVAKLHLELDAKGFKTGADMATEQAKVAAATQEMRQAAQGIYGYQDRVLQYLVDSGVLSAEAAANMRGAVNHYVPLHRMMDNMKEISSGRSLVPFMPIKGRKGGDQDILSPIETIIRNTHLFIDLAEQNRAMNALEDAALSRGMTDILKPVSIGKHPVSVHRDEVEKFLKDAHVSVPPQFYGAPDNFTIFRKNAFNPKPNEIVSYRNGKPHVYQVDKDLAQATNGMGAQQVSDVMRLAAMPTQALRAGAVLGPELLLKNPMRDQFSAAVLSKNGYVPLYSYAKGLRHYFQNGEKYQNWLKGGGANAALTSMDRRYIDEYINTLTRSGLFPTKDEWKHPVRSALGVLSKLAELGEQPTRIADFASATDPGWFRRNVRGVQPKTIHEGSFDSREVTLDFQRRGSAEFIQQYGRLVEFFTPTLQGPDRLIRALDAKNDPKAAAEAAFKIAAYVVTPTVLAYALNRQDPRMREIARHERDTYWHIPVDNWQPITAADAARIPPEFKREVDGIWEMNTGVPMRYPKPFEIGILFGSSLERALDAYFYDHPEDWSDFRRSVFNSMVPGLVPTFARVPMEAAANYSTFREGKIVSDRIKSPKDRRHEYFPHTTETAKYLAGVTGALFPQNMMASPAMVEFMVNSWSGNLGAYALQGADLILKAGGEILGKESKTGQAPERTWADIPGVKAVFTRMPSSGAASVRDFYKNQEDARATLNTVRRLNRDGEAVSAGSLKANEVTARMDTTSRAISAQYRFIEAVRKDLKMTPREKRVFMDKSALAIIMMAKQANDRYYAEEKRLKTRGSAPGGQ